MKKKHQEKPLENDWRLRQARMAVVAQLEQALIDAREIVDGLTETASFDWMMAVFAHYGPNPKIKYDDNAVDETDAVVVNGDRYE